MSGTNKERILYDEEGVKVTTDGTAITMQAGSGRGPKFIFRRAALKAILKEIEAWND